VILRQSAMRAFRLSLRAFPPSHRHIFGDEAVDTFGSEFAARMRGRGRWSAFTFTLAALLDALQAGLGERRRHSERERRTGRAGFVIDDLRHVRSGRTTRMGMSWLDVKLGFRMLSRYPGLTVASALALAIAIGLGAGWYDLAGDFWRPRLPLPGGDRIVELEMRNLMGGGDERRLLHDFLDWRRDLRSIQDLSAYRTIERNLVIGDARPEPITGAEITASAFRLTRIAPLHGRPLLESDEHPGAPPVVVLGFSLWQQRFGGRPDVLGDAVQLGRTKATIVGIMPEGYTFPINHRLWVPLQLHPVGYAPLEGVAVRVFGRVAEGADQAQANAELVTLVDRTRAASPTTHERLSPRILAYGGESPGDRGLLELAITHLPIILVLLVACANVGTLVYARTATREGEIATRYALGASRGRIIGQLFVEALVLASVAAAVGLVGANWALKSGLEAYYSGQTMPFWLDPGLKPTTVVFAVLLTVMGAAILGILPALKVTGRRAQAELRNLGAANSTLKFGAVWTTAMIAQVALTVVCLPPAAGISYEAIRDRQIRASYPAEKYVAVRMELDREAATTAAGEEPPAVYAARLERTYREFERRLLQQPEVRAVTFGDRLPGMDPAVRRAEVEVASGSEPTPIPNLWSMAIGPGFFAAFEVPLLTGRDFHDGDRVAEARTVIVNEAFARRYFQGASPVGRRVRYASADATAPEPWLEIVGMVRDIGMTPTDLGEAPYVFRGVNTATASPLVMAVKVDGDPATLTPRVRTIAADIDPGLRLDELRSLDDLAWRVDMPAVIAATALVGIVGLGLFLSAAGIFALMSVSVSRRTREIGLRAALGASQGRLLAGVLSRALLLVGSGIVAGNLVLMLFVALEPEADLLEIWDVLLTTSVVMLVVGLLACVVPARRALRIHPTDALKEA
jgi:putative ABC transport system permease protein